MYEENMQNFMNYPGWGYPNTYDQMNENYYSYYPIQNRNNIQTFNLESEYPEIYKIVYPMVKKVCSNNTRGLNQEIINNMVDEVYSNIEVNQGTQLNITLNNEVKGEDGKKEENRNYSRNNLLNDLIRILILRELNGKTQRPRPYIPRTNTWQGSPFFRYE